MEANSIWPQSSNGLTVTLEIILQPRNDQASVESFAAEGCGPVTVPEECHGRAEGKPGSLHLKDA